MACLQSNSPDKETTILVSIIVGSHKLSSYKTFLPKFLTGPGAYNVTVVTDYPFVHLLPNGRLYIFTRQDSIMFDYVNNRRNLQASHDATEWCGSPLPRYKIIHASPSTHDGYTNATVMICGGTFANIAHQDFNVSKILKMPASDSCGSLTVSNFNPVWSMFTMPMRRIMGDMVLLPYGKVMIVNGAMNGTAGWEYATTPCLYPVIFDPITTQFEIQAPSRKPRMYHSTANLLPDSHVLIAGKY